MAPTDSTPTADSGDAAAETLRVEYVGPKRRGTTIASTGQRVRPAASTLKLPVGADGTPVDIPSQVDVPVAVALRLVRRADFVPVGWDPADHAPPPDDDQGDDDGDGFPRHKGGGSYELSDGSTVRGHDAAVEAEAALHASDAEGDDDAGGSGTDQED